MFYVDKIKELIGENNVHAVTWYFYDYTWNSDPDGQQKIDKIKSKGFRVDVVRR